MTNCYRDGSILKVLQSCRVEAHINELDETEKMAHMKIVDGLYNVRAEQNI